MTAMTTAELAAPAVVAVADGPCGPIPRPYGIPAIDAVTSPATTSRREPLIFTMAAFDTTPPNARRICGLVASKYDVREAREEPNGRNPAGYLDRRAHEPAGRTAPTSPASGRPTPHRHAPQPRPRRPPTIRPGSPAEAVSWSAPPGSGRILSQPTARAWTLGSLRAGRGSSL